MCGLYYDLIIEGETKLEELKKLRNSDEFNKIPDKKRNNILKTINRLEIALIRENPFHVNFV